MKVNCKLYCCNDDGCYKTLALNDISEISVTSTCLSVAYLDFKTLYNKWVKKCERHIQVILICRNICREADSGKREIIPLVIVYHQNCTILWWYLSYVFWDISNRQMNENVCHQHPNSIKYPDIKQKWTFLRYPWFLIPWDISDRNIIDWLCTVLSPAQEIFTYMETSQLPVKGCKI
jgi:hypothetical protein